METFQLMPLRIEIESVSSEFVKKIEIEVQSCPLQETGSYKVEDWSSTKQQWTYLQHCQFLKAARDGIVDLAVVGG